MSGAAGSVNPEKPVGTLRLRTWLPLLTIILSGILVYHNSLAGPFVFDDEEAAERMRKEAQETFNKCAQIAALENNPGMSLIFDQIENMAAALHKNNEAMMQGGTLDPNKMQANIMAAVKLKELKIWIQSKMEGYKREIGIKGSA